MAEPLFARLGLTQQQLAQGLEILQQPRTVKKKGETVNLPPVLIQENGRFFRTATHRAEIDIARHIRRIQAADLGTLEIPADVFGSLVPDDSQRAAVEAVAHSNVVVVTGGPGVGKTTVAKAQIAVYTAAGLQVVGCAPTGKAAVRMKEQTGREAFTVHQLVKLRPGSKPKHHEGNPIQADVVVLDESSMVDVSLAATLFRAIPTGARVLIIGDVDQLPSIGAGRFLFDLIASQTVPVVKLTKIHRQASESRIPYVARDINNGQCPDLNDANPAVKTSDVRHFEVPVKKDEDGLDEAQGANLVIHAVTTALPQKGFRLDDIQVLAPQKAGDMGVVMLNVRLQKVLNAQPEGAKGVFIGGGSGDIKVSAYEGDRVIQTSNNYDLGVMNGEIGKVIAMNLNGLDVNDHLDADWTGKYPKDEENGDGDVDENGDRPLGGVTVEQDATGEDVYKWTTPRVLVVDFGTRKVAYAKDEVGKLHLAYCITIHKSQGSQFPAVVMVTHGAASRYITRPLIYTGITRASHFVLTVGTLEGLAQAARNTRGVERRTMLQDRLANTPVAPRA